MRWIDLCSAIMFFSLARHKNTLDSNPLAGQHEYIAIVVWITSVSVVNNKDLQCSIVNFRPIIIIISHICVELCFLFARFALQTELLWACVINSTRFAPIVYFTFLSHSRWQGRRTKWINNSDSMCPHVHIWWEMKPTEITMRPEEKFTERK